MKRLAVLTLFPALFARCSSPQEEGADYRSLKYVVPTGAPAIALSSFASFENFETVTDPSNIIPMMVSGQADVAVLPTNVGISAIKQKGVPFKLLSTITFGNFYIASTGKDSNGVMEPGDYIVSFQQGAVPDKVFHYVHGDELDDSLHYVSSAQEAAKCLKSGKNLSDESKDVDYVLIAEPALTTVLNTTPAASVYEDLQSKYKEKSNGLLLCQASIFVKNSLDQHLVMEKIAGNIKMGIENMISNPTYVSTYMNSVPNPETIFGVKPEVAEEVMKNGNRMGIDYKLASNIMNDINNFLTLFNMEGINEEIIA